MADTNKTTILISYPSMMIGGSTTSLLSILTRIDYSKYDVDLLLDVASGELLDLVPSEVNILKSAYLFPNHKIRKFINMLNPRYMLTYYKSKQIASKSHNYKHGVQFLEMKDVELFRQQKKHYDVAISFLEGRNCKFVANHISASKKIGWIHIDYKASNFDPRYDLDSMSRFDHIITVSNSCKESFDECFPSLVTRTCVIENILSEQIIRKRSEEKIQFEVNKENINLVTSCRVVFSSKGLDRAVRAFSCLKKECGFDRLKWYIIGDGVDMARLKELIASYDLTDSVYTLGNKVNPYPYLKLMDVFFLPSIWEGKPMAVTEAFMLGLPVLVTNYLSANEQVRDGVDGKIVANSQEGIEYGLRYLLLHKEEFLKMKEHILSHDYSNDKEMQKVINMLNT